MNFGSRTDKKPGAGGRRPKGRPPAGSPGGRGERLDARGARRSPADGGGEGGSPSGLLGGLLPSGLWGDFICRLAKKLGFRDRLILLLGLTLPAVNKGTNIGSFGVAIKAIMMGVQGDLTRTEEYVVGGIVFAAFVFAALIRFAAGRVEVAIDRIALQLVRGIAADQLVAMRTVPPESREEALGAFQRAETKFIRNGSNLLRNLITFVSLVLVLLILLAVIVWVSPLVAGIFIAGVVAILLFMRKRIRGPVATNPKVERNAAKELSRVGRRVALAEGGVDQLKERYIRNSADSLANHREKCKKGRSGKISVLSGIGSAFAMAALFFLASDGALSEHDPAVIIVLILALRVSVGNGRTAMEKWSRLLSDRERLGELRKMVVAGTDLYIPPMNPKRRAAEDREDEDED